MNSSSRYGLAVICLALGTGWLGAASYGAAPNALDQGQSESIPWSGPWWPQREGALVAVLEKYDAICGTQSAIWHRRNFPNAADVPIWHGICHGWAASASLEPEPREAITIWRSGHRLSVDDQKGLLAASHTNDIANVYGTRNDGDVLDEAQTDLGPDELWFLLQRYVRDRRVPLILDLDAGAAVWNFPVFQYRVEDQGLLADGRRVALMTIWVAQTSPSPNYVGTRSGRKDYRFAYRVDRDIPVIGSGEWLGASREDHPDFAWYPFVAVSENPHLDYRVVRNLLIESSSLPTDDDSQASPHREDIPLDNAQLLCAEEVECTLLVEGADERFHAHEIGQPLRTGQRFRIAVRVERTAYLYVQCAFSSGQQTMLVPRPLETAPLAYVGQTQELPSSSEDFTLDPPGGVERLTIVASERRLTRAQLANLDQLTAVRVFDLPH